MKIIICGAGQVGTSIARQLADEHNDVTVIDWSADLISRIGKTLDVQGIVGYASHPDVLERADAKNADMLIAATLSDEVNMIACQIAHTLFDVQTKIARIRTQAYVEPRWSDLFSQDHLPIDVIISPEHEVARAILRRLQVPGAFDAVSFADDKVQFLGIHIDEDCPLIDTPLSQLTELFPGLAIRILGIRRGEHTIVPTAADQMLVGDDVYIVTDMDHRERSLSAFGHEESAARRLIIIGGGNVGFFIANELEQESSNVNVKIIEASAERAEEIAGTLEKTIVLHGDALDADILHEANVSQADAVIAVANDDEVNILSSLLAKKEGCERAITLVNNNVYRPLMSSLGVDIYIDPRATTVSTILHHVRRGRIRALHSLPAMGAEVLEVEALETSHVVGKSLRDLDLPAGILFGALVRHDKVIIPRGDTVIQRDDRVILFALADQIKTVEQMFSVQLGYF
jgi:trk system potassium uptake protein